MVQLKAQTVMNLNSHVLISFPEVNSAVEYYIGLDGVRIDTINDDGSPDFFVVSVEDSSGPYVIEASDGSSIIHTYNGLFSWEDPYTLSGLGNLTLNVPRNFILVDNTNAVLVENTTGGGSYNMTASRTYYLRTNRLVYKIDT